MESDISEVSQDGRKIEIEIDIAYDSQLQMVGTKGNQDC